MKTCQIFKIDNKFIIVTLYRLESWSYISSEPIFILPDDIDIKILLTKVFESLENSRDISEKEENEMWLGHDLLKLLKVKSFSKLYKESVACIVSLNEKNIEVTPYEFYFKTKGLSEKIEDRFIVEIDNIKSLIEYFSNYFK
ncbi:hypothetical protein [Empedobacter falsenii]|uniref:Uncharacterized protein n=1 Tax=Empedobacter falsenii TaxID=343874 RepID=A0AAW7DGB9_9FLAO|nr:hypothetical protein [Empedobacter falsenii]MDM1550900.1 hypothetical protein [Empedobacter falsenii]